MTLFHDRIREGRSPTTPRRQATKAYLKYLAAAGGQARKPPRIYLCERLTTCSNPMFA